MATVHAYILIQTEVGKSADVANAIRQLPGITLAEDVTGPTDMNELGRQVVAKIQAVPGITRTLTCPVVHF